MGLMRLVELFFNCAAVQVLRKMDDDLYHVNSISLPNVLQREKNVVTCKKYGYDVYTDKLFAPNTEINLANTRIYSTTCEDSHFCRKIDANSCLLLN